MDDVPDLKDSSGRLKRIILALTVAVIVGAAVYGALYAFARPDDAAAAREEGVSTYRHARTKIANTAADKKYMRELTPEAKLRR